MDDKVIRLRPKKEDGRGDFFAVDRVVWSPVCKLGSINAAVAYLVLARGTGGDNRTTSWSVMMADAKADEFTTRMFDAINGMMLDMLAAVARKDYEDRRRRQAQGQQRAKEEGRYKGRREDARRNEGIAHMLASGRSYSQIQDLTGASRATIAKISKRQQAAA
jgi:hypothetical protein